MGRTPREENHFPLHFPLHIHGTSWDHKKRPLGSHPQRSGVLFPVTSSECSSCSAVRSRRTVRRGGEDRSGFGRPQAIKKAAGNAATKGDYASKVLSFQRDHPLKTNGGAVGAVYELPKKGGSLIPPHTTHCPFTEEATEGLRGVHLLVVAITTK